MLFDCFNNKTLEATLAKWVNCLKEDGIFAIIEDADRPLYKNFFEMVEEGKVTVNKMRKYYFIGKKRSS